MIAVIDYGMGNLGSILNMLKKIGVQAQKTSDPSVIEKADKLILPGVGAFDHAIENINNLHLGDVLNKRVLSDRIPVLGVCLGMQLLTNKSEEGTLPGLGWIPGKVIKFSFTGQNIALKIPHMGWNAVTPKNTQTLFKDMPSELKFYFVHSYHVVCDTPENVLATSHYGIEFTAAIQRDSIFGVQFHPEKSHKFGMMVYKNFANL